MASSAFATAYSKWIKRLRFVIFAFWIVVCACGLKWGLLFLDNTTSQYDAPESSASMVAARKYESYFKASKNTNILTILLRKKSGAPPASIERLPGVKDVELGLYNLTNAKYGYDVRAPCTHCFFRSMQSYWLIQENFNATQLAEGLVAESGVSTIINIKYSTKDEDKVSEMVDFVHNHVDKLLNKHGLQNTVSAGLTGIQPFADAILDGISEDLEFMDKAVLPLALIVLGLIVQSLFLMLIPVLNIVCTILAEFLIMYPVALNMDVVSFTPSVMMSLTIAMSIDYSLFLLSRLVEEVQSGVEMDEAIPSMLDNAGHTITVSGGTLVICFLGMLFFPMAMLQSVGIGASTALLMALFANLTLTPAVLHSIGPCLINSQQVLNDLLRRCCMKICGRTLSEFNCNTQDHDAILFQTDVDGEPPANLHLDEDPDPISVGINGSAASSVREKLLGSSTTTPSSLSGGLSGGEDSSAPLSINSGATPVASHSHASAPMTSTRENSLSRDSKLDWYYSQAIHGASDEEDLEMRHSCWYKLTNVLLDPKKGIAILLAITALCTPICMRCFDQKISISFELTVPSTAHTYDVFEHVQDDFGAGAVFPYQLLFVPTEAGKSRCDDWSYCQALVGNSNLDSCGVMCPEAFNDINTILRHLQKDADKPMTVTGITTLNGQNVTAMDYVTALAKSQGVPGLGHMTSYDDSVLLLFSSFCPPAAVNSTTSACAATAVQIDLGLDPFSLDGVDWLIDARDSLKDSEKKFPFKLYLSQSASITYDAQQAVYDSFPMIIIVTLSVVFVLMAVAFQSLVAPIRSVLTLCLTLSFVFGLLVLVYQHDAFNFLNQRCVRGVGATAWLPPVMCFSIIVGLGLDYDVFLISRVFEYRLHGYTDHAAALKGVYKTGYIITAAGVIMALAFGGLMNSTETILNQTSFLLIFSVLLDTFVVRTLAVPALLGLTDTKSWWPKQMPPATKAIRF